MNKPVENMLLAQIHGIDDVRVDTVPVPQCGENDVVVAVKQCGICGSDLGYIAMGGLLGPGNPMPIGHEMSAVVTEVGGNVTSISIGDRVVVNPMEVDLPIGNLGPEGGFAPFLLVRDVAAQPAAVQKIPDSISDDRGALVEPMSVAMHSVHQGSVTADDKVVVFGAGTIGLCITMVLKYYGVKDVIVVDTVASRLKKAAEIGATTFTVGSGDLATFIQRHQGSDQMFGVDVPGTDVYFEATGVTAVFEQIVGLAKSHTRVVVVGVHKKPASIDLVSVLSKELTIRGSMAYPDEFPQVIEMLEKMSIDPEMIITHHYPLSKFTEALDQARDTESTIKVLIDCQS